MRLWGVVVTRPSTEEALKAHGLVHHGSDLTYEPGDPRRYLDDSCTCGWTGPYSTRYAHLAEVVDDLLAAVRVEAAEEALAPVRALMQRAHILVVDIETTCQCRDEEHQNTLHSLAYDLAEVVPPGGSVTVQHAEGCSVGAAVRSQWRNEPHWHAMWPNGDHWCFETRAEAQARADEVNEDE